MIRFEEAVELLIGQIEPLAAERVRLPDAHGRTLAAPVRAAIDSPRADVSVMDGYAVRTVDLGEGGRALPVRGESRPGLPRGELPPDSCMRIFTGAPVPAGADRIVMQEEVERAGDIARFGAPGPSRFIRLAGSDFRSGELLLPTGCRLTPAALVAAAAADVGELLVHRRPRVRLVATGDELVEPGSASTRTTFIPDSVSHAVAALAREVGAEVLGNDRLKDELEPLRRFAATALIDADVIVVSGGASVGERDFARAMFADVDPRFIFSKVAMKPGKPVWLARAGRTLVLGLPGNPASAMVTARLFLAPLLRGLVGGPPRSALRWRTLPLAVALPPTGSRETFARGYEESGCAHLFSHQDSNGQKVFANTTLLVRLPPGDLPVAEGSLVEVLDF